jgi:hypothetical protein
MTSEMAKRIAIMAMKTWNAIGGDVLTSLEEAGEDAVMPRDHVIEVVCDADHMQMYGQDKEAYEVWKNLSFDDKEKTVGEAFPYSTYGW